MTKGKGLDMLFFEVETLALTPLVYEVFESRYYQYDDDGLFEFLEEYCGLDLKIYNKYYIGGYTWLIIHDDFPYILKIIEEAQNEI